MSKNEKNLDINAIVSNAVSSMEQKVYGPLDAKLRELTGDQLDSVYGASKLAAAKPKQLPPK